ncbi:hypothetical protein ACELLULO517_01960 [Acidisoma cellulosilytica]|uniref:C-type lysozyme inhibitor domain-containing protein n=1 Tax=Acidisoma cellulosilyticum TaxID=2802395 RepID=A0A963YYZ1_9PROT|nr:hypothetical protein [Acidisoma cellulosilyticum]MCB8878982.1 hypothetical protein [Acidisoma cellulosilyticum]
MLLVRPTLVAACLLAATALSPFAALAQTNTATTPAAPPAAVPPGLIGAWGSDSSCTGDVAIFRADGTVINPGAPDGATALSFTVSGDGITLSDGKQSGTFAFALSDQAVAWSNGASMVLKERCADQAPFAAALNTAANAPGNAATIPAGPLPDQISALAGQPLTVQGNPVQIQSVQSHAPKKAIYTNITALPDPQAIPGDARLYYRIFPTAAAAASYVSLAADDQASFLREPHGAGFFSTASATDEGPQGSKPTPVTIDCLRFHPKRLQKVVISCFAAMPGSKLVAGAEQSFALPPGKTIDPKDMGQQDNLTQVLSLTGLSIGKLRGFLADHPQP